MVSITGTMLAWGIPQIQQSEAYAIYTSAQNNFLNFDADLDQVLIQGEGSSRSSTVSFSAGTFVHRENLDEIRYYYETTTWSSFEIIGVKNEATKLLKIGNNWKTFHEQVGEIMTKELMILGLIDKVDIKDETKKNPAYKKYFMHGTSHHLGLDTHDYGLLEDLFQENMVFTVEPGIYLPKEEFGIRLEDDVVIKSKGEPINLMADIPIEADEIEEIMNS